MSNYTTNSTEIKQNVEISATKPINDIIVIGIDHGYGNMKTAHCCFPAAVSAFEKEPVFKDNLLVYNGKFYRIGDGHREFTPEKIMNEDYYILTLAALAQELTKRKLTEGKVHIAAGLPLTWVTEQKERFKEYLMQNDLLDFTFNGTEFHVEIVGADIFPQGFAAVAQKVRQFKGTNLLCDIGNGTVNCLYINNGIP
jgi:plasmid segregation protein ParM